MNNSHDPLNVLHGDELPVQPDPAFAARLRARLESALSLPNRTGGVVMSGTDTAIAELAEPTADRGFGGTAEAGRTSLPGRRQCPGRHRLVRRCIRRVAGRRDVRDGRRSHRACRAADRRRRALPGRRISRDRSESACSAGDFGEPHAPRGRHRHHARTGARARGRWYNASRTRTTAAATPRSSIRSGTGGCSAGRLPARRCPIQHGDVGYVSVWTPDADRAAAFYGHVLGWTYDPQTHQVTNTTQHIGIYSVDGPPTLFCCYAVADLAGASKSILDGGGTVDEVEQFDFGTLIGATDSQGASFAVFQPNPGHASSRAQRHWAGRTFVHHIPGVRLDGVQGLLQPRAVLDLRARATSRTAGRSNRLTRWPVSRVAAPSR